VRKAVLTADQINSTVPIALMVGLVRDLFPTESVGIMAEYSDRVGLAIELMG